MVAAGDARYEVFHYLITSLIDCPPEKLTREHQQVTVQYDTDSGLCDEGVPVCVCVCVCVCTCVVCARALCASLQSRLAQS